MNTDNLFQLLQKGLRVTIGATASLVETMQDPMRREETLAKLRADLNLLADEWAVKGEATEREARHFVDTFLSQRTGSSTQPGGDAAGSSTPSTTATIPTPSPIAQQDLQELTEEIAAIRSELEKIREQNP